jgi:hypothetical protein
VTEQVKIATTADDLFAEFDCKVRAVNVPEWKRIVHLRELPADEGVALAEQLQALPKEQQADAVYLLLEACICDEKGQPLLKGGDRRLRSRSSVVIMRLQSIAQELQGWNVAKGESPGKAA